MNPYLKNVVKLEFVVTDACTGRCKHCSQGEHGAGERIDPRIASDAVEKIGAVYPLQTVMVFGGEPLLHREAVYDILEAAEKLKVPRRQLITNGYFSKEPKIVRRVAMELAVCGVNDLLLSVDAFHQETIPLEAVKFFASEVKKQGIPLRLQPAWLVSLEDDNPYNRETRELLRNFSDLEIPWSDGNVVFPEGNARKYLASYFRKQVPDNPYVEDPKNLRCISFSAGGDVLGDNLYRRDIMEILAAYSP